MLRLGAWPLLVALALGCSADGIDPVRTGAPVPPASRLALSFRAPSVPLLVRDPYFSLWSASDHPAGSWPRSWNDRERPLAVAARVDGTTFRLLGTEPTEAPAMPLSATEVRPSRTTYHFAAAGVSVTASFITPMVPDSDTAATLPGSFIEVSVTADDRMEHDLAVYVEAGSALARADENEPLTWRAFEAPTSRGATVGLIAGAATGSEHLYRELHELPDWGQLVIAADGGPGITLAAAAPMAVRAQFVRTATLTGEVDAVVPGGGSSSTHPLVLALAREQRAPAMQLRILVAHARDPVVQFDGRDCRAPWAHGGTIEGLASRALAAADGDRGWLRATDDADDRLLAAARASGGTTLVDLVTLAHRQTFGAVEACRTGDARYLFMKELASGSLIQTADVILPAAVAFLRQDPAALGDLLRPFLDHVATAWSHPYPPHDLGIYPVVESDPHFADTPVETAGDLLLLVAAHLAATGDLALAQAHEGRLRGWADLLAATGGDPPEQLSTDDFTGPLAHNATLGLKAALAVGAMARIEAALGHGETAAGYDAQGRALVAAWRGRADAGDRFALDLSSRAGWSLKYNLLFDRLLGLRYVGDDDVARELAFYLRQAGRFGVPLDHRFPWAKADWLAWVAALGTREQQEALLAPIARFLAQASERVPFTDLYDADTGTRPWAFQARPVVGAMYAPLLLREMK